MNCSRELIEAYLDEELAPALHAEIADHLASCRECSEAHWQLRSQQESIRSLAPYFTAPASLRQSIRESLRKEAEAGSGSPSRNVPWRWLAIAASALLAASLTWNFDHILAHTPEAETIAQNVVASHVRSLIGTHLLDVTSTDQHTVKPWFNGKLDFSPDVKDFASQGFPLIGGRIEYLSNRPVAALIYRRRQHIINLFTWPSTSSESKERHFARNGFNILQWSDASMTYWAVSDIAPAEIEAFRTLWLR